MSTLKEIKDLLVDIVGDYKTSFEVVSSLKESINELKQLINDYTPDEESSLKDALFEIYCTLYPIMADKDNFFIDYQDIWKFVDDDGYTCFDGIPCIIIDDTIDEVDEVGYENGQLYITCSDEKMTNIPEDYKKILTKYFQNIIDTIKCGNIYRKI